MNVQECFNVWLSGTTCGGWPIRKKHSIKWISECGKYAIFHHAGHSTYTGRYYGNQYCSTYYVLVDVNISDPYDTEHIFKWEGRWNKNYITEAKKYVANITKYGKLFLLKDITNYSRW